MSEYIKIYPDVLPAEFCKMAVDRFMGDKRVQDDPQPDYSTRRFLNLSKCSDWLGPLSTILEKTNEVAEDYFSVPEGMEEVAVQDWIDDGFIMSRYKKGDNLVLHVDGQNSEENYNGLRLATMLFFLTTCKGGELHFPLQNVKVAPCAGTAVIFPSGYSHPHEVLEVETDRFIVQTWLTDPELKVVAVN